MIPAPKDMRFARKGMKNANAKLTDIQVASIRSEYKFRKVTARMLAAKYGVFYQTIHRILRSESRNP